MMVDSTSQTERGAAVQTFWIGTGDAAKEIHLPSPETEVLPGILWGRGEMLDTAAYWALRCMTEDNPLHGFISANACIVKEIGFCLLGGFGVKAEINGAAFERLDQAGVFELSEHITESGIRDLLIQPLLIAGRPHRYRFPNQRARRIASMRNHLSTVDLNGLSGAELKEALLRVNGIGPKTAAWIIRNHFDSDEVAILDVHVVRACARLQLFPASISLPRDYEPLEAKFLMFAHALEVRPAILDAVMWQDMRGINSSPRTNRLASH